MASLAWICWNGDYENGSKQLCSKGGMMVRRFEVVVDAREYASNLEGLILGWIWNNDNCLDGGIVNSVKLRNERDKKITETRQCEIVRPLVDDSRNAQNGFTIELHF